MEPLVSILMPTYNRPNYFEQALQSALAQTYTSTEIVVSDNSENHLTENIVKSWQTSAGGEKIRYIRNKQNIGPIANIQQSLRLAKGEFINYLNDDDLFHPRKIEKMMEHMQKDRRIVLVTSPRRVIDGNGNRLYVPPLWTFQKLYASDRRVSGRELSRKMLKDKTNYLGEPTTVLFRRSALKEPFGMLGGKQVYFAVDLASWLNLLTQGDAVYVSEPLSFLRYHPKQLSRHKDAEKIKQMDVQTFKNFARSQGYLNGKAEIR